MTHTSAGSGHTCATRIDGTAWCWGSNFEAQLGIGTTDGDGTIPGAGFNDPVRGLGYTTPVQVGEGTTWVTVEAGAGHTVALAAGGSG